MDTKRNRKRTRSRVAPVFVNRELSWLQFNQRVLEEAVDPTVPLLERLKFLAITASNLDEFGMVRVGGLQVLARQRRAVRDSAGLTPSQQLKLISRRLRKMVQEQYACFTHDIEPALHQARIRRLSMRQLDAEQTHHIEQTFAELVYPVITPMAIPCDQPFPLLAAQDQHVLFRLADPPAEAGADDTALPRRAVVSLPPVLPRFVTVPARDGYHYVHLEDLVIHFSDRLFMGETVESVVVFRLTRNADMQVREDEAHDLLSGMEDILDERRTSHCVRLDVAAPAPAAEVKWLAQQLGVASDFVLRIPGPLDLAAYMRLATMGGFDEYKAESWTPQCPPALRPPESMFDVLRRQDVLLAHPYDSFDPVVRLIDEAADDPGVLAIKQILYRTSASSPIVAALARAAGQGKQVTVLVELKARFDEARNIEWARALEKAGVQVIYGVRGFKTHAKVCIIIRREASGIQRYVHFGTGNYNERTARLYTDISYMTAREDYGADAATFFNTIAGYGQAVPFRKIEAAPFTLRQRLLEGIEGEIERCAQGQRGHIIAKVNSLVDPVLIEALYRASQTGVRVQLIVRGICCLRPGVKGLSEHIEVISIVDRLLEHSRIIYFRQGGDPVTFISSADWMPRNLDRRIELLVPVDDPEACKRLRQMLEVSLKDNVKGRVLQADDQYIRRDGKRRGRRIQSQAVFQQESEAAVAAQEAGQQALLKPHRPL